MRRRPITISDTVPPNTDFNDRRRDAEVFGTDVELLDPSLRIYPGPELDLKLRPLIISESGSVEPLILWTGGKNHISGDDDDFQWRANVKLNDGDRIVIDTRNDDLTNSYDYRFNAVIRHRERRPSAPAAVTDADPSEDLEVDRLVDQLEASLRRRL